MINHLFDVVGEYCATTHVKDVYLEDRFVVHVAETIPGTGMMDLDTVLLRTAALAGWLGHRGAPAGLPGRPRQAEPHGAREGARHRRPMRRVDRVIGRMAMETDAATQRRWAA